MAGFPIFHHIGNLPRWGRIVWYVCLLPRRRRRFRAMTFSNRGVMVCFGWWRRVLKKVFFSKNVFFKWENWVSFQCLKHANLKKIRKAEVLSRIVVTLPCFFCGGYIYSLGHSGSGKEMNIDCWSIGGANRLALVPEDGDGVQDGAPQWCECWFIKPINYSYL